MLRAIADYWFDLRALSEDVNDRDLEDGAGEVILEILRTIDCRLKQKEIYDKQDLRNAVCLLLDPVDGDCRLEEGHLALLLTAFRLLAVGYYRNLLIEERERVGRMDCRGQAMHRFKERLLKSSEFAINKFNWI